MAEGISPNPGACRPVATPAALTGELLDELDNAPIPTFGINGHCMVTSVNSTCSIVVTIALIDSPTTVGNYEVQINTNGGGAGQLRTRQLIFSFTVVEEDAVTVRKRVQSFFIGRCADRAIR